MFFPASDKNLLHFMSRATVGLSVATAYALHVSVHTFTLAFKHVSPAIKDSNDSTDEAMFVICVCPSYFSSPGNGCLLGLRLVAVLGAAGVVLGTGIAEGRLLAARRSRAEGGTGVSCSALALGPGVCVMTVVTLVRVVCSSRLVLADS